VSSKSNARDPESSAAHHLIHVVDGEEHHFECL
jgi:hypothetical protein